MESSHSERHFPFTSAVSDHTGSEKQYTNTFETNSRHRPSGPGCSKDVQLNPKLALTLVAIF